MKFADDGERGSALIYILIAIALLALLTITFMQPASQQTQSQNSLKTVSDLGTQIDFIRSAVQECVANFYKGDATIDTSPSGSDPGASLRYPIAPNSTHFTGATPGPATGRLVKDLRCPGNPGDDKSHVPIFGGSGGKYLPPAADLFNDWQWYNGDDGVFFWTSTDKTDAYIQTALNKLVTKYATCEADVVDAKGGAQDLDSGHSVQCPAGSLCFRIRMITNPSAVYNGNDDGSKASCP